MRVRFLGRWTKHGDLWTLFFLHGLALGVWFVPLSTVLDAHGYTAIKPYAFATSAVAAFITPLLFGAMADRHLGPVRVLRLLSIATAVAMALAATAIHLRWTAGVVLALIQLHALFSTPTWSISSSIVFSQLTDSKREFGPIRAVGTIGWVVGCLLVSVAQADSSGLAAYGGSVAWLLLAWFTATLPQVAPPRNLERLTWRQRFGLDALTLFRNPDHRVVFITSALFSIPLAAFYPFTPTHLKALGLERTSAWMSIGQITEVIAMVGLAGILTRFRLKWVFATGLACGTVRYLLCALDTRTGLLFGIFLHGFAFTLFYITAQLYLDERIDPAWRARAQALMSLMNAGVGNLIGYLACGWWLAACTATDGVTRWSLFWTALAAVVGAVLAYFLVRYRGRAGST